MKSLRTSKKFKIYRSARKELTVRFPTAFPRAGVRPPLKVGILEDLKVHDGLLHSTTDYRVFLGIWTRSTAYLKSIKDKRNRVDLTGKTVSSVQARHSAEAAEKLASRSSSGRK